MVYTWSALLYFSLPHNTLLTITGHSLETFPEDCAAVRDAGHEIGLHGYTHETTSVTGYVQATNGPRLITAKKRRHG
jgi:peptidoglycan/xylan/chitin deacetylase (PgdA/CDA1 family)